MRSFYSVGFYRVTEHSRNEILGTKRSVSGGVKTKRDGDQSGDLGAAVHISPTTPSVAIVSAKYRPTIAKHMAAAQPTERNRVKLSECSRNIFDPPMKRLALLRSDRTGASSHRQAAAKPVLGRAQRQLPANRRVVAVLAIERAIASLSSGIVAACRVPGRC
jgi:hypothetical protein